MKRLTVPRRPNKTAAGMTKTAERSGHDLRWLAKLDKNPSQPCDALTLSVRGTLDRIGRNFYRKPRVVTYYSLNDRGRQRLAFLLRRRKDNDISVPEVSE